MNRPPPRLSRTSTLFPYTTLFRSDRQPISPASSASIVPPSVASSATLPSKTPYRSRSVPPSFYGLAAFQTMRSLGQTLQIVAFVQCQRQLPSAVIDDARLQDRKSTRLNSSH